MFFVVYAYTWKYIVATNKVCTSYGKREYKYQQLSPCTAICEAFLLCWKMVHCMMC